MKRFKGNQKQSTEQTEHGQFGLGQRSKGPFTSLDQTLIQKIHKR
jgi:hypothetical protein